MDQELQNYIEKSRQAGKTDDQIRQELLGSGWREDIINSLFQSNTNKSFDFEHIMKILTLVAAVLSIIWVGIFGAYSSANIVAKSFFSPNSPIVWGYNNGLGIPFGESIQDAVRGLYLRDKISTWFFMIPALYLILILNSVSLVNSILKRNYKLIAFFILISLPLIFIALINPLEYVRNHL